MKEIQLTQGKVALVDDDMFDYLNQWKWHYAKDRKTGYAIRHNNNSPARETIRMHRVITNALPGDLVDHKDRDGCNNQRHNLRHCTDSQNMANRSNNKNNKSGFKGVSWDKGNHIWMANIVCNRKRIYLGCFRSPETAAQAYNQKAIELFGEFAQLNDV